ncbi:MAG: endonuclease/exonuclease/phosphatase family protein, partial [Abditibacteriales bacterium]|nr:endonuclease/exonuclease/phosphatase family protein [Abditibacteriales bacterium]MDW8366585.1 endonuclease/exonuclease/phosphatase family protein [Abditibacteriales bacterium]
MMKVLTLNIGNYHCPWRRRCELIRQLIERERPDLVGLQEVGNDWWCQRARWNQAEQINRGLGYHVIFRPAATYWRFPLVQIGQAMLSRHPMRKVESFALSRDPDDPRDRRHPRSVLRAEVETAKGHINFFVTHFSLSYHARNRAALELWEFVQR